MRFFRRFAFEPIAKGPPEAIVVLLNLSAGTKSLASLAARWAVSVPSAAFLALDCQLLLSCEGPVTLAEIASGSERALINYAGWLLEPIIALELRRQNLDARRLVLVGFRLGGTLALHMLLERGACCAGVLAFAAKVPSPISGFEGAGRKVRLIERATRDESAAGELGDLIASLVANSIDARAALVPEPVLSEEGVRHGGAYLVELVATAQRGDRFHADRGGSGAWAAVDQEEGERPQPGWTPWVVSRVVATERASVTTNAGAQP